MLKAILLACVVVAALCGAVVRAQSAFDVASIRPSTRMQPAPLPSSPDQLVRAGFTLLQLVQEAFQRDQFSVTGGPDWINSTRFDVTAKAEKALTPDERRAMTRRLLEERFALKTHAEMRELEVFAIVLARKDGAAGPQLRKAAFDCTPFMTGARPISESPVNERGMALCVPMAVVAGGMAMTFRGSPIEPLARRLQGIVRRPVIDRTGLAGVYDIDLKFTVDGASAQFSALGYPALMTAMEEQLGLKLESRKAPMEVLVIDDAKLPTPN